MFFKLVQGQCLPSASTSSNWVGSPPESHTNTMLHHQQHGRRGAGSWMPEPQVVPESLLLLRRVGVTPEE